MHSLKRLSRRNYKIPPALSCQGLQASLTFSQTTVQFVFRTAAQTTVTFGENETQTKTGVSGSDVQKAPNTRQNAMITDELIRVLVLEQQHTKATPGIGEEMQAPR